MPLDRQSSVIDNAEALAKWLDWAESDDKRFRDSGVSQIAAHHALAVQADRLSRRDPPLTEYGLASCAASMALVLTDVSHPNHTLVMERLRKDAANA